MGSCVSMPERRIVLLGRKGDGKSSAGNTILGEKVFTAKASGDSVKAICEIRKKSRYGSKITVIETPGFFDTDHDDKEMKSEIIKAMVECAQGVDAFVIVLKVGEYTSQEIKVLQQCLNRLKEDVFDHTVILFTFGEQLEDQTIEEFLKANSQLQKLVDKCGGHCHVIDNKHWKKRKRGNKSNKVQVKNLLETIAKMRQKNGCFTNELFQKIEKQIQEEIGKMEGENLPPEEKREKAKKNVQEKILVQAAGVTIGALTGALLGACSAIAVSLALLQMTFPLRALQNAASNVVRAVGGAREAETGVTDPEEAEVKTGEKEGGTSTETREKAVKTGEKEGGTSTETGEKAVKTGEKEGGTSTETGEKAVKTGEKEGGTSTETGEKAVKTGEKEGGTSTETGEKAGATAFDAVKTAAAAAGAGTAIPGYIYGAATVLGAVGGGITGWEAAEEADSMYDAMNKAAQLNYKKAKAVTENMQQFFANVFNNTAQSEEKKKL